MKRLFLSDNFSVFDFLVIYFLILPVVEAVRDRYGILAGLLACVVFGLAGSRTSLWLQRKAGIRTITLGGGL